MTKGKMDHKNTVRTQAADLKQKRGVEHHRVDDFVSKYANNVHLELSSWDIKLNFGEIDQRQGPHVVMLHTAITLPWPYVKVLSYVLQQSLLGYESQAGRIKVPSGIIVPLPAEKPRELDITPEAFEAARELYENFLAINPEAVPKDK
jgi:hypothetical protein